MDPGMCPVVGAMYEQLHGVFKVVGRPGVLVACYRRDTPRLPPVGRLGEHPHHSLEVAGRHTAATGMRGEGRPTTRPSKTWTRRMSRRGAAPHSPIDAGAGLGSTRYMVLQLWV